MPSYQYRPFPYVTPPELRGAAPRRWPVVVVGAGPVGLAAAIDLALHDIDVLLLDDNDVVSAGSRSICWSKRTLEILDRLGCGERMIAKGRDLEGRPAVPPRARDLQLRSPARDRAQDARVHQPPAVLRRGVPGRSCARARGPHRAALEEPRSRPRALTPTMSGSKSRRRTGPMTSTPNTCSRRTAATARSGACSGSTSWAASSRSAS